MYLNKVFILGNLTKDPEMKALPSGMTVTNFSLATNRIYKDKNGAKQTSVDYHNIVVFGRQAETCNQYLRKGSQAMIEGRITTRSWDGQDGKKQYRTEIMADSIQFGTKPTVGSEDFAKPNANTSNTSNKSAKEDELDSLESIEYPEDDINPEDIPF